MILDTGTLDAGTLKALCDLLCRAYGTSGAGNPYKMNVSRAAVMLEESVNTALAKAQTKPKTKKDLKLVKKEA